MSDNNQKVVLNVKGKDCPLTITEEMLEAAEYALAIRIRAYQLFGNWQDFDGDGKLLLRRQNYLLGVAAAEANYDIVEETEENMLKEVALCEKTQEIVAERKGGLYTDAYQAVVRPPQPW